MAVEPWLQHHRLRCTSGQVQVQVQVPPCCTLITLLGCPGCTRQAHYAAMPALRLPGLCSPP